MGARSLWHPGVGGESWPSERALTQAVWLGAWRRAALGSSAAKRKLATVHERLALERAVLFASARFGADVASLLGWAYLGLTREVDRLAARAAEPSAQAFAVSARRVIDGALAEGYGDPAASSIACPGSFLPAYRTILASRRGPPSISQVLIYIEEQAPAAATWQGLPLRPDAPSPPDALTSFELSNAVKPGLPRHIPPILALVGAREGLVLGLRHGWGGASPQPMTLDEIGRKLRLTRERVRQIAMRGYSRLRRAAAVWG